ncbi:MAG: hypothetical protein SNJ77_12660, partial [Cytophagales bacterium]
SLQTNIPVSEASIDQVSLRVTASKTSDYPFEFERARLLNLLSNVRKVRFTAIFNTPKDNVYYNIYSDYEMDIKLLGDFNWGLSR